MTTLVLMRGPGSTLIPADDLSRATIDAWPLGSGVKAEVKRARNLLFHRKAFSLLQLAFDIWEPEVQQYKGVTVAKNFDRFRKDITILSGFFKATHSLKGEVRLEAESLSFASMGEDRFALVYKAILDVVWRKVLKDSARYQSPEEVERVVNQLVGYDS